eukprot:SAG31_NODE_2983_length_4824_cov_319.300741_4_plen_74_part_00
MHHIRVLMLSVSCVQDKKARRLTRISGSPASHIKAFRAALEIKGQPSLQNSLTVAKVTADPFTATTIIVTHMH